MVLHIIGSEYSTCTQRVNCVLAEKGVTDFTTYTPDMFGTQEHKKPPFTDIQPFGVIPILQDGDFNLCESRAICRYIAEKYADQGTKLVPDPSDLKAAAKLNQALSVEYANWDAYAFPIVNQKLFRKMRGLETIQPVLDGLLESFNEKLDIFDIILGKQKYMAGDEFSLVDIFYLPYTQKLFEVGNGDLITSRPNVKAWWERVSTRDSWKKAYVPLPH